MTTIWTTPDLVLMVAKTLEKGDQLELLRTNKFIWEIVAAHLWTTVGINHLGRLLNEDDPYDTTRLKVYASFVRLLQMTVQPVYTLHVFGRPYETRFFRTLGAVGSLNDLLPNIFAINAVISDAGPHIEPVVRTALTCASLCRLTLMIYNEEALEMVLPIIQSGPPSLLRLEITLLTPSMPAEMAEPLATAIKSQRNLNELYLTLPKGDLTGFILGVKSHPSLSILHLHTDTCPVLPPRDGFEALTEVRLLTYLPTVIGNLLGGLPAYQIQTLTLLQRGCWEEPLAPALEPLSQYTALNALDLRSEASSAGWPDFLPLLGCSSLEVLRITGWKIAVGWDNAALGSLALAMPKLRVLAIQSDGSGMLNPQATPQVLETIVMSCPSIESIEVPFNATEVPIYGRSQGRSLRSLGTLYLKNADVRDFRSIGRALKALCPNLRDSEGNTPRWRSLWQSVRDSVGEQT